MRTRLLTSRERLLPQDHPHTALGQRLRRSVRRAAAVVVGVTLVPRPAIACSLVPTFTTAVMHRSALAFLGRPTADTVRAGRGPVEVGAGDGHFGRPTASRAIHGQVVRVERLAPGLPATTAAAVRQAGQRVVLVPWDYAADCQPVPWAGSARWLPTSAGGLFQGILRDRVHWLGGVPTLDVFAPQFVPYTGTGRDRRRGARTAPMAGADSARPLLTPDELLALRATLPTWDAANADPHAAYASLRAWAAAHPSLAGREPAREVIRSAEWSVADFRFRQRPVPLAGTYRVTIWIGDTAAGAGAGDSTTFYARTQDRPTSPLGGYGQAAGMYVLTCAAAREAALPTVRAPGGCDRAPGGARGTASAITEGYLAFGDSTWIDDAGRTTRAGSVDVEHGDSAFRARVRQLTDGSPRRLLDGDPWRFLPGHFTETADGTVSFARTLDVAGAPRLRITARRISTTVLQPRERRR